MLGDRRSDRSNLYLLAFRFLRFYEDSLLLITGQTAMYFELFRRRRAHE